MPRTPLPRYRVRQANSRHYPWLVYDADAKQVHLSGFDTKQQAQAAADELNAHRNELTMTTHDAFVLFPTTADEIANNRALWTADLRSGQYQQAQSALAESAGAVTPEAYCCLGVAVCTSGVPGRWEQEGATFDFNATYESPPEREDTLDRRHWSGDIAGTVLLDALGLNQEQMNTLIALNDEEDAPFVIIADAIDAMEITLPDNALTYYNYHKDMT